MTSSLSHVYTWLAARVYDFGAAPLAVKPLTTTLLVVGTLVAVAVVYWVLSRLIDPFIGRRVELSETKDDDKLLSPGVRRQLWRWIAIFALAVMLPAAFTAYPRYHQWALLVVRICIIVSSAAVISSFVNAVFAIIAERSATARETDDATRDYDPTLLASAPTHSLGGVRQMLQLVITIVTAILIFSALSGKNIVTILTGLGASAAVLMLVFKDSILGLVAGIQLTVNDMLRPGDWISMPKYDVNGRVRKVNLTTVKVQNYDNTIVTIPPYQLVSETFQNWRGMERSGGRRVMRAILIDQRSIRFCTEAEAERWNAEPWAAGLAIEAGRTPNISVLRAYLGHYVSNRVPTFVPHMLWMIRELQPSPTGLPLEIYFFTSETEWKAYETVQADVIDHVIATLPSFGLRIFQSPSDSSITSLSRS